MSFSWSLSRRRTSQVLAQAEVSLIVKFTLDLKQLQLRSLSEFPILHYKYYYY